MITFCGRLCLMIIWGSFHITFAELDGRQINASTGFRTKQLDSCTIVIYEILRLSDGMPVGRNKNRLSRLFWFEDIYSNDVDVLRYKLARFWFCFVAKLFLSILSLIFLACLTCCTFISTQIRLMKFYIWTIKCSIHT